MLTLKLATLDGLTPDIAKEYKADPTGGFVLDTDVVYEDTKALKNALQQERDQRKQATEKVTALETSIVDLTARAGTATELEKSWQAKLTKSEEAAKAKHEALTAQLRTVLVDNVATSLASEISTAPTLILPHIRSRITIAEEDGKLVTRVLGADGKASALSVNELKEEFVASKDFAPIITGSKASGGGASGGSKGGTGGAKSFAEMNEAERTALYKADPVKFDQLAAQAPTAKA